MSHPRVAAQPPEQLTKLITDPSQGTTLTARRECDATTALTRGVAEYLRGLAIDFPGGRRATLKEVIDTWADTEQEATYPSAVVRPGGEGVYDASVLTPNVEPSNKLADGRWAVEGASFELPMYIELVCTDPDDRSLIAAAIEDALNPVLTQVGFKLLLPHYHSQVAVFEPMGIQYLDSEEDAQTRKWIARFRLSGAVSLTRIVSVPEFNDIRLNVQVS